MVWVNVKTIRSIMWLGKVFPEKLFHLESKPNISLCILVMETFPTIEREILAYLSNAQSLVEFFEQEQVNIFPFFFFSPHNMEVLN